MNFNPRSPRGGATEDKSSLVAAINISIHAPHEGERPGQAAQNHAKGIISIHAPHEGERQAQIIKLKEEAEFQSTLPTRGSDCHKQKS